MKVLSLNQVRLAEKNAVSCGDTYENLMLKAGLGAANEIEKEYNIIGKKIIVVCGKGNNGGDGLVIANALSNAGAYVKLYFPVGFPVTDTAKHYLRFIDNLTVCSKLEECDYLIDAVFGIGLDREITGELSNVIEKMNNINAVKIAVDIPSGLFCDGNKSNCFFKADFTVTFIGYKLCFLLPKSSSFCGKVVCCDLGLEPLEYSYLTIDKPIFKKRDKNSHKGTFGTVLSLVGSYGMCGAQILQTKASVKSGAGIVKTFVCDKNYSAVTSSVPEVVTVPVPTSLSGAPLIDEIALENAIKFSNSLVIGCGLGNSDESTNLIYKAVLKSKIPTVLDADGINAVSKNIDILKKANAPIIITPHPKEMARLFGTTVEDVENNRVEYALKASKEFGAVTVLKGANTIVCDENGDLYFNVTGNPGMATAGSGDVLSGIIGALLSSGYSLIEAAKTGVYIHGLAGDIAAQKYGEISLCASDIIEELPNAFKQ